MMSLLILALVALVLPVAMAKRRSRRRWNPNNFVNRAVSSLALSTLAASDLISGALTNVSDNEYRAISLKMTWAIRGLTAGEGPITVGVAHGDYTAAEIEEWFESTTTMTRADQIGRERGNRKCRQIGTFPGLSSNESLNDGKPLHTRLNWAIPDGIALNMWAFNSGSGTLTTGAVVTPTGQLFGRWT